jgi:hypothetical protein
MSMIAGDVGTSKEGPGSTKAKEILNLGICASKIKTGFDSAVGFFYEGKRREDSESDINRSTNPPRALSLSSGDIGPDLLTSSRDIAMISIMSTFWTFISQ